MSSKHIPTPVAVAPQSYYHSDNPNYESETANDDAGGYDQDDDPSLLPPVIASLQTYAQRLDPVFFPLVLMMARMNLCIPSRDLMLQDALASGEFGSVYRGTWQRTSSSMTCAIKIFKQSGPADVNATFDV